MYFIKCINSICHLSCLQIIPSYLWNITTSLLGKGEIRYAFYRVPVNINLLNGLQPTLLTTSFFMYQCIVFLTLKYPGTTPTVFLSILNQHLIYFDKTCYSNVKFITNSFFPHRSFRIYIVKETLVTTGVKLIMKLVDKHKITIQFPVSHGACTIKFQSFLCTEYRLQMYSVYRIAASTRLLNNS